MRVQMCDLAGCALYVWMFVKIRTSETLCVFRDGHAHVRGGIPTPKH